MERVMRVLDGAVGILTGEFLLSWYPNGGTVVMLRTILTSLLLYATAIALKCLLITGLGPELDWGLVREQVAATIPWLGAIVAGVYTALYARFASQWTYMAGLYNQVMATQAQAPSDGNKERERVYTNWKAGIVEDAYVLHLAGKPMFAPLVAALLEDPKVVKGFVGTAVRAEEALAILEVRLSKSLKKTVTANRSALEEAVEQGTPQMSPPHGG